LGSCPLILAAAAMTAAPCAAQGLGAADSATAVLVMQAPPMPSTPPDFPRGKISGYMFGDLYYNLSGDPNHVYTANGADAGKAFIDGSSPITKDLNGAQLRRIYFQLDNDLSAKYSTRFRLEMDSKALTSDGKVGAFVKNAYLQAKSVIPRGDFYFGMINTPTWESTEDFWQYRSVEKVLPDFRGLGSSADLGAGLKGHFDGEHHVGYSAMIGTGTGQKPETDRYKKFYLAVPIRLGDLRIEPYADYQSVRVNLGPTVPTNSDSLAATSDQATYKVFAGYEFRRVGVGFEAVTRVNHKSGAPNQEPRGFSLFARASFTPTLAGFARVDQWQPNTRADNRVDSRLWIAGLDWQPFKDVHVMPNVEATQYLEQGTATVPSHHDLQGRITFYYKYSKPQS
jgi:hypothetical protein